MAYWVFCGSTCVVHRLANRKKLFRAFRIFPGLLNIQSVSQSPSHSGRALWAFNSISESSVIIGPRYTQVGLDVSESVSQFLFTLLMRPWLMKILSQNWLGNVRMQNLEQMHVEPSIDCGKLRQSCNQIYDQCKYFQLVTKQIDSFVHCNSVSNRCAFFTIIWI